MLNRRRRLSLAAVTVASLLAASGASADPINMFTGAATPSHVPPSTTRSYTVSLTSDPSSPDRAQRATIAIPSGFDVDSASVQATTTAVDGSCVASTWVADGVLIADQRINLRRPGGDTNALCPGATLIVAFDAESAATDGTYAWTSELLNDTSGAFTLSGSQPNVIVDGTAPAVTISGKPADPSNDGDPTFVFSAGEPSTFECKLDDAAFAPCSSPQTYPDLADGNHTFAVRATDAADNTGEATHTWRIDTAAPTTAITAKPADPTKATAANFSFTASETGSSFSCRLNGGAFEACASPTTYTALGDGSHSFEVKATDQAGNTGAVDAYAWTIDTVAPTATIIEKPEHPTNDSTPRFTFTSNETGSTFACRLEEGGFAPCSSPKTYDALVEGQHAFAVRATDLAGNTGAAAAYTWTIDTVAPTATILEKPEDPTNESTPRFTFTLSEPGTFTCSLDGGAFVSCSSPKTYPHLVDATHTFAVKATDAAGNTGPAAGYTWRIDTGAPTIELTATPADPSNVKSASFVFGADDINATFACKLDNASFGSCSSPQGYLNLADGRHTFSVRATNAAGNTGEQTYAWTIDTVAPAAAITAKPSSPTNSRSPSFAFTAGEAATFYCKLDLGGFAPCGSPHSYSDLPDGTHTFAVFAADAAGNVGPQAAYDWLIKTQASGAVLTSAPPGLSNSSAASFAFSAAELSLFECNLDDRGFTPCGSPATYHGLADGPHGFSVRAQDGLGNLSAPVSHSWTVDTIAPETRLTTAPTSGRSTSATFWFTASEAGTFECRLDGAAFALCGSPKSYGGLSLGHHQFEVRAIDAAGNAETTPALHRWRVDAPAAKKVASALLSPKAGARTTRPPLLVWRRVKNARYYNVQVFRGSRKVFSGWPTRTRLQLRAQWKYLGRKQRLVPGSYRWYLWPGYGAPSAQRYGPLLGQSTFVVARSGRR